MANERLDILAVMREEMSRGRRPIDEEQRKLNRQFVRHFNRVLKNGSRRDFEDFIIAHGQPRGSAQFVMSMRLWQQHQNEKSEEPSP